MAKPSTKPRWSDVDPGTTTVEPPDAKKDVGFVQDERVPAQWINWLWYWIYEWILYLDTLTDEALTWTAAHIFQKGITVTNSTANIGVTATGGSTDKAGVKGTGGASNGNGVEGVGTGTGIGVFGTGGASGGVGVAGLGIGSGKSGAEFTSGSGAGVGVKGISAGSGAGVKGQSDDTGPGVVGIGGTGGNGGEFTAGSGGKAVVATGPIEASTTMTAGTGITAATGNIAASSGSLTAAGTVSGNSGPGLVKAKRYYSTGTALVSGDFALDANWGTGAAVSVIGGCDGDFRIKITAGSTPAADPYVDFTFKEGTWTATPIFDVHIVSTDDAATLTGLWTEFDPVVNVSTTTARWYTKKAGGFTPVNTKVYWFVGRVRGV